MSKVKLILSNKNSLNFGEVTTTLLDLKNNQRVIGIVETEFEPEGDGSVRTSDGLDPVITIENINHLMGQVLTLVEASTVDPEQRKAAKDLFRQTIWGWYTGHNDGLSRAWRYAKGYESNSPRNCFLCEQEFKPDDERQTNPTGRTVHKYSCPQDQ